MIGAFAPLASFALFHLVTVFPLSWVVLYVRRSRSPLPGRSRWSAPSSASLAIVASGCIADRSAGAHVLGVSAVLIGVFSGFAPQLLDGGEVGETVYMLVGFVLLGLSFGQSSGAVTSNFAPQLPLHRRGARPPTSPG